MEELQTLLDAEADRLLDRLECPVTGTSVREAWDAERRLLQPLPSMSEPFDVVVTRKVHRDCLVSFEGRRYSVPFRWVGHTVEVLGTAQHVVIQAGGREVARHPRHTQRRLVLEPTHYDGESTRTVLAPPPIGRRGRLQLAHTWEGLPEPAAVARPLTAYIALVEEVAR